MTLRFFGFGDESSKMPWERAVRGLEKATPNPTSKLPALDHDPGLSADRLGLVVLVVPTQATALERSCGLAAGISPTAPTAPNALVFMGAQAGGEGGLGQCPLALVQHSQSSLLSLVWFGGTVKSARRVRASGQVNWKEEQV